MAGFKMGNDNNGPFQVVCFHCGNAAWGACVATGYGAVCKSCLGVTNPEAVVKLEKSEIIERLLELLDLDKIAHTLESGDAVQILYLEDDYAPSLEISGKINEYIESVILPEKEKKEIK